FCLVVSFSGSRELHSARTWDPGRVLPHLRGTVRGLTVLLHPTRANQSGVRSTAIPSEDHVSASIFESSLSILVANRPYRRSRLEGAVYAFFVGSRIREFAFPTYCRSSRCRP